MPKAKDAYRGQKNFGHNDPCMACGRRSGTKNVCRACNEVGCGQCLPYGKACKVCGKAEVHNLQFSDLK